MKLNDPAKVLAWLQKKPSPRELRDAFPAEWETMEQELAAAIAERDPARLHRLLSLPSPTRKTLGKREKAQRVQQAIRQRMAALAIEHYSLAIATGKTSGKVRFNLFNGLLAQWLLFREGFERKPVSMLWFRLLWPLVWQRNYLMPLVESKGIYCFYSKPLVKAFARLAAGKRCLEIAAGDGTLTRFLRDLGTDITATDDHSWAHKIRFPDWVERMDAKTALSHYRPQVAICSWPPAQNSFEATIFSTPEVELYITIQSQFRFASGNWAVYEGQQDFTMERYPELSRWVLPPELGSEVVVFRRKGAETAIRQP
jgi:hypothetical protein